MNDVNSENEIQQYIRKIESLQLENAELASKARAYDAVYAVLNLVPPEILAKGEDFLSSIADFICASMLTSQVSVPKKSSKTEPG